LKESANTFKSNHSHQPKRISEESTSTSNKQEKLNSTERSSKRSIIDHVASAVVGGEYEDVHESDDNKGYDSNTVQVSWVSVCAVCTLWVVNLLLVCVLGLLLRIVITDVKQQGGATTFLMIPISAASNVSVLPAVNSSATSMNQLASNDSKLLPHSPTPISRKRLRYRNTFSRY
jgi:hypothetical protein